MTQVGPAGGDPRHHAHSRWPTTLAISLALTRTGPQAATHAIMSIFTALGGGPDSQRAHLTEPHALGGGGGGSGGGGGGAGRRPDVANRISVPEVRGRLWARGVCGDAHEGSGKGVRGLGRLPRGG